MEMEISRKPCRLCLTETEFNVSLFGNYCRRTNMIDKILVCLKIVVENTDAFNTICSKCANNVEKYYDFITYVRKCQNKLADDDFKSRSRSVKLEESPKSSHVNRRVTSYVREQVFDADYTFSFLEAPEEKKEANSSPFFSYFSPPNVLKKPSESSAIWKTPRSIRDDKKPYKKTCKSAEVSQQCSRDIFESQSQDNEEPRSFDWKLTPDDNIIKRVREKCFGKMNF